MLIEEPREPAMNEQTIELIAERVITALRDDLEAIAGELSATTTEHKQLTVEQVAHRLGVARSTVYAHWRDWGGYKLGAGHKAPIRFDSASLPTTKGLPGPLDKRIVDAKRKPAAKKPRRRDLLIDAPRLGQPLDGLA